MTAEACVAFFSTAGTYAWYAKIGIIAGGMAAGALVCALLLPLLLCLAGFTCYGILNGSCAACCQSRIGDVEAGSWFAGAQSAGAGGCPSCYVVLCVISAIIGAGLGGYIAYIKTCSGQEYTYGGENLI